MQGRKMKHLKILELLVVAGAVLATFAASASATTLTSPAGTLYTGEIQTASQGHTKLHHPMVVVECNSKLDGVMESHGSGVTATGKVTKFTFESCTNSWHKTTAVLGALEVHHISGTSNGTVTSHGTTITTTRFGVICNYLTFNTHVGTLTGGSPAILHIEGQIPVHSGSSAFCGTAPIQWTGSYKVNVPTSLFVDA
jgi:hypothetical protein